MSRIKKYLAHSFECDLDLEHLHTKLEAIGPWPWRMRDSFYFGDYLAAKASDDASRKVKIYERQEGGFQVDIFYEGDESAWDAFYDDIMKRMLPGVGATDFQETETMN